MSSTAVRCAATGCAGCGRRRVPERMWRDAKLLEIGGGTLESHQKNITKDLKRDSSVIDD